MIKRLSALNDLLWRAYLKEGMVVADCTLGNGYDAERMLEVIGKSGWLYGFDIQDQALMKTRERLKSFNNFTLYRESHEYIKTYLSNESLDAAVFNLGYLPSGDRQITTLAESTLKSVKATLDCLKIGGLLGITVYRGHPQGADEDRVLSPYLESLNADQYHLLHCEYPNQGNKVPHVYYVIKKA